MLSLGPVEKEVARKVKSMMEPPEAEIAALLGACRACLGREAASEVNRFVTFAASLPCISADHPDMGGYLSHPLRVARLALDREDAPRLETAALGLFHNVFEVSGLTEAELESATGTEGLAGAIRVLTIDRRQELDPGYLEEFYARIETFGRRAALIRCVDKLDNILGLSVAPDGGYRDEYLALTERFVVPMASRIDRGMAQYLQQAISYQRSNGSDDEARVRYESYIRRSR